MAFKAILVAALLVVSVSAVDYCNIKGCTPARSHTMCLYPKDGASSSCKNVVYRGLTGEEKKQLVDLHNELRNKVASGKESRGLDGKHQPAATNMNELQWDDGLAEVAQRWADQCNFSHDKCRSTEKFSYAGQNLAWSGLSRTVPASRGEPKIDRFDVKGMAQGWYDEVKDFDPAQIQSFTGGNSRNGEMVGHYTQFVWGETTHVGCGVVVTKPVDNRQGQYIQQQIEAILACNYGPGGNIISYPIYKTA